MDLLHTSRIYWISIPFEHASGSNDQVCPSVCMYIVCTCLSVCCDRSVFVGVSERQLAQGSSRRLKERQRIEDDLKGYHSWIRRARMSVIICISVYMYIPKLNFFFIQLMMTSLVVMLSQAE